jgi:hypothetical protein
MASIIGVMKPRTIRFEDHIYTWVKAISKYEKRPFNNQINYFMERCVESFKKEHPDFDLNLYLSGSEEDES